MNNKFDITVLLVVSFFCQVSFTQDLSEGLLLHYSFDGSYADESINENDGIAYGTTFVTDRFGVSSSACYFDGINDYINFPNLEALKPELPVSFAFWVKYDDFNFENTSIFNTSFEEDVNSGIYLTSTAADYRYAVGFGDGSYGSDN